MQLTPEQRFLRKRVCGPLFLKYIPRTIKDQFKAACAVQGVTMNDAIVTLMKKFIYEAEHGIITPRERKPKKRRTA